MMPTIKDVAEKAGVGIATVSRAMNGTGYVSARSREKIETAIRELHYIPNYIIMAIVRWCVIR